LVAENNSRIWRLFHERYCICGCSVAATAWRYRGKDHFTSNLSIGLMEPGEIHCVKSTLRPSNFKAFFVDLEVVSELAREAGLSRVQHLRIAHIADPVLFAALNRAASSIQAGESSLDQQVNFVEFLTGVIGYAEELPSNVTYSHAHNALRRARDLLHARFNEPVTLTALAEAAHISRFHLVRSFTHGYGIPPHAYQLHVRIERARALLRSGLHSVQVASSVGFSDQSHFARHFKKIMRVTPSEYARGTAARKKSGAVAESFSQMA
jgi:AraC-like DNA-binding protein